MSEIATGSSKLTTQTSHPPDGVVLVFCQERLVAGVADILTATVHALIPDHKRIILDLSLLRHMDSTGLGTLLRLYVAAKSAGSSLELMHVCKQVRQILVLTHLFDVFTIVGEKGVVWKAEGVRAEA